MILPMADDIACVRLRALWRTMLHVADGIACGRRYCLRQTVLLVADGVAMLPDEPRGSYFLKNT